jgi:lipopolysaccharide exporter
LMPSDFGIVTIAMIIVGSIEIFNQTGQYLAIIRHPNPTREHYDSAWTIFIILSTILALVILLCAPLSVIYFHEPRATLVVECLALKTFIGGFENVGILNFQKHFEFHKLFLFRVLPSLVSFFVTLAAAFILRNYWALVIGILTQEFSSFVLSYILSPFRPRLCLTKVREIWSFSIWTCMRAIGGYLGNQIDKFVIGGFAGATAMGSYEIAVDVSSSPSQEINNPMMSVLFPVMAAAQGDRQKLRELYLTVLYWSVLICTSTAVGVAVVSNDLVDVVLGSKWAGIKPLMPWLALAYGISGYCASLIPVFDTLNKPHISARTVWFNLFYGSGCLIFIGVYFHSPYAIALARFASTVICSPVLFLLVALEIDIRALDFVAVFWRPWLASLVMAAFVLGVERLIPEGGLARLSVSVLTGVLSFSTTIMILWFLIGCPDGPEKTLWHIMRRVRNVRLMGSVISAELESGAGVLHRPEEKARPQNVTE